MKLYFSFFLPISLLGCIFYIYSFTNENIKIYKKNPPFLIHDFTGSDALNKQSNVKNLLDGNDSTYWIKEKDSPGKDLTLELRLSHFYLHDKFLKKKFLALKIKGCEKINNKYYRPNKIKIEIFKRESINIDKELRLPKEVSLKTFELEFKESNALEIPLSGIIQLADTEKYPKNIYIIGIHLDVLESFNNLWKPCLNEIELVE